MANLSEYLAWRGELSFEEVGLTLVDALLLSQISYVNLTGIIGDGAERTECTILEASELFWSRHTKKEMEKCVSVAVRTSGIQLAEMAATKRFQNLILRNYVSIINDAKQEQFAAVEIVLGEGLSYISFAGTDDTLIGWKEDFNMCFLSPVPAQIDAKRYLERVIANQGNHCYIGGHSKGGNLAIYSSIKCRKSCAKKILHVYNFDGPGFDKEFITSPEYLERKQKIETWIPEASIVGLLLEHEDAYQVVKSSASGLMEHDATSWEVMGSEFIRAPRLLESSRRVAEGLKNWMDELTGEELENFCNAIFSVLTATKAKTLADLTQDMFKSVTTMIHSFNTLDKQSKKMLLDLVRMIVSVNTEGRIGVTAKGSTGKASAGKSGKAVKEIDSKTKE